MMADSSNALNQCLKQEVVSKGRWLQLNNIIYQDREGNSRVWESVNRTTRPATLNVDSVGVLAVLKRTLRSDCFVLVRQFRPPLNSFTLEFPAGLIGEHETPEQAALRELKEETGYIGTVKFVGPVVAVDPGISNSTMQMITVEIDGDNSTNINPLQRKSDEASIEVVQVPVSELAETIQESIRLGTVVDSRVHSFCLGFAKGKPRKGQLLWAESMDEK